LIPSIGFFEPVIFKLLFLKINDKTMNRCLLVLLYAIITDSKHFNGGNIIWEPVDPYDNSSSITITIIQSYWWSYPTVTCAANVPISTPVYVLDGVNVTCIADCLTSGGYLNSPITAVTDCTSTSLPLGVLTSQRSKNVTLTLDAHFYIAFVETSWIDLNNPPVVGLGWSIACLIDLHIRPDGFINTPPTASVVSPQYAIVNKTLQIQIIVLDVNTDDDVRCRWSSLNSTVSPVNECGGVCYPASMPSGVNLSNCTLSFTGPVAGIWYAAAIQVRNDTIPLKTSSLFTMTANKSTRSFVFNSL
jgi:hypothetical protein